MSKRNVVTTDLSVAEQENIRNLLFFLRVRLDAWGSIAKIVQLAPATVVDIAAGRRNVPPNLVFRLARFMKQPIDDLLSGAYPPPGMCPRCGYTDVRVKRARRAEAC